MRRQNKEIYYYQTQQGKEIDFLTIYPNGEMALYQVCLIMQDEATKQRELTAIIQGMDELKLQQSTIITMDQSETLQIESGSVHIIPLWQFLTKDYMPSV